MIFSDSGLKLPLPGCYQFMQGFGAGGKVIIAFGVHFMKITMYLRHPFVVFFHTLLCLHLCLPGPVTVQVKIIMIGSAQGPGFAMFSGCRISVGVFALYLCKPVHIAVTAIGIYTGVNDNHRIF